MTNILQQLLAELNSGHVRIVDLTSPLEPATPVIDLPPIFAPSPGVTLTEISHYDSRGPAWYWNVINMGEHTGTHFDAPIHWVTGKDLSESRKLLPPNELKPISGYQNFDFKSPPRFAFEQVARAFGLDVVFDGDYPHGGNPLVLRMDQADYRQALHALEAATASFVIPLGPHLFMVAKDTQQKRNDVEPSVTVVISIPQTVTVQEAQELARAVQQVMEIKRFGIDSLSRLVVLNGPLSKVRPAQKLFEDLTCKFPVGLRAIEM